MKTARERARQVMDAARGCRMSYKDTLAVVEHILREFARDQRHLCAERVSDALDDMEHNRLSRTDAHAAAMNAPFPGEE